MNIFHISIYWQNFVLAVQFWADVRDNKDDQKCYQKITFISGNFKLVFDLKTPTFSDSLIIHDIIVYATKEDAIEALGNIEEGGGISFLKLFFIVFH